MRKLAVFDIDGTIFRSSLTIALINGLVEKGIFPKRAARAVARDYHAWLDRKGSYEQYLARVVAIYYHHIPGCAIRDVERVVHRILAREKDRVYVFTRGLVRKLKKEGYFLLAISGSPEYIVSHFADYMGFDAYFGSGLHQHAGKFTARELNSDAIRNKARVLKNFLATAPFCVDLKRSIAVGDSPSDISLLKLVGRPIAFNPDDTLARTAERRGWEIVVERKNVIYQIHAHSFLNGRGISPRTRRARRGTGAPRRWIFV